MDALENLSDQAEKMKEQGEQPSFNEEKELLVQEYSFEQSTQPQGAAPTTTQSSGPQKLYPGAFMTPKPSYRRMSFAPGRTHPLVIGISGGKSSGKTTLASTIKSTIIGKIVILEQKLFYKDVATPELSEEERLKWINANYNFDSPEAIDWEMFVKTLDTLLEGSSCQVPVFDEETKRRTEKFENINAANVIIIDGDMIFYNEELRKKINIKIFVDTDEDVRLSRRVLKHLDDFDKTITLEGFLDSYFKFVKPGYEKYVEPSKKYADIIIPNYGFSFNDAKLGKMEISDSAIGLIVKQIESEMTKI